MATRKRVLTQSRTCGGLRKRNVVVAKRRSQAASPPRRTSRRRAAPRCDASSNAPRSFSPAGRAESREKENDHRLHIAARRNQQGKDHHREEGRSQIPQIPQMRRRRRGLGLKPGGTEPGLTSSSPDPGMSSPLPSSVKSVQSVIAFFSGLCFAFARVKSSRKRRSCAFVVQISQIGRE